jgi:hypothetical protein
MRAFLEWPARTQRANLVLLKVSIQRRWLGRCRRFGLRGIRTFSSDALQFGGACGALNVYFGDGCFRATEVSLEGREQSISLALTQRQMQ